MAEDTVFHKIVRGELPADVVYETDEILAFKDIRPQAPTHVLFIPKKPEDVVPSVLDLTEDTAHIPSMLTRAAQKFAEEQGIPGYQLVFHVGQLGGQEVFYIHLHFMSKQKLA